MSSMVGRTMGLAAVLLLAVGQLAFAEVEIKSKAVEIKLTGRQHTQFNTTSVDGELGSEFLVRRARITAEIKLNDFVHGKVQPDYGSGKISLKDAFLKLNFSKQFQLYTGQFKRPFDLFELTSSTKILVVERAGKIRGASGFNSLSSLTEGLHYADRDIGIKASFATASKAFGVDVAVTNGQGANKVPSKLSSTDLSRIGEKQFGARALVKPRGRDLAFAVGVTALPVAQPDTLGTPVSELEVEYSKAVEVSAEIGDFKRGLHVQAGAVFGDNWKADRLDPPGFTAVQGIVTYKHPLAGNKVTAIEPVFRVSWADPDTDTDDDATILFTPGVQFFFIGRNKMAFNVDVFSPQADGVDSELSIKVQWYLHF